MGKIQNAILKNALHSPQSKTYFYGKDEQRFIYDAIDRWGSKAITLLVHNDENDIRLNVDQMKTILQFAETVDPTTLAYASEFSKVKLYMVASVFNELTEKRAKEDDIEIKDVKLGNYEKELFKTYYNIACAIDETDKMTSEIGEQMVKAKHHLIQPYLNDGYYSKHLFNVEQLQQIQDACQQKINPMRLLDARYTPDQIDTIAKLIKDNINDSILSEVCNPKFTPEEMKALTRCFEDKNCDNIPLATAILTDDHSTANKIMDNIKSNKDTHSDMTIKEFQKLLLDKGFKIGGCVEYFNDEDKYSNSDQNKEKLQDVFFYKDSALIKTTEYFKDNGFHRNQLSWHTQPMSLSVSGYMDINIKNCLEDQINGKHPYWADPLDTVYHWSTSVKENLFYRMEKYINSDILCKKPTCEYDNIIGVYQLSNLVTERQNQYAGIVQEELGGSHRHVSAGTDIDNKSFDCYELGELMGLQENIKHFTPEFKENLSNIIDMIPKQIEHKKSQHRDKDFLENKAMPILNRLVEEDSETMEWRDVKEIEKDIKYKNYLKEKEEKYNLKNPTQNQEYWYAKY